jgi:hypothetical protein
LQRQGNNTGSANIDEGDLEATKHVRRQILRSHEWLGPHSAKPTLNFSLSPLVIQQPTNKSQPRCNGV